MSLLWAESIARGSRLRARLGGAGGAGCLISISTMRSAASLTISLLMMALHARVQVLAEDPGNLAQFMTRLNKATCAKCPSNRFITFFFSVLDASTGELAYANAGHNPPILVRANGDAEM